jgi:hypothetical protein
MERMAFDELTHVHELPEESDFWGDFYSQGVLHGAEHGIFVREGADSADTGSDADVFFGCLADSQPFDEPGTFVDDKLHFGDEVSINGGENAAVPFYSGKVVDADPFHFFSFLNCSKNSAILVPE